MLRYSRFSQWSDYFSTVAQSSKYSAATISMSRPIIFWGLHGSGHFPCWVLKWAVYNQFIIIYPLVWAEAAEIDRVWRGDNDGMSRLGFICRRSTLFWGGASTWEIYWKKINDAEKVWVFLTFMVLHNLMRVSSHGRKRNSWKYIYWKE